MDEPGSHFINPATLNIDPSLGIVTTGVTEIAPPTFNSETGEAAMPAAINPGRPLAVKRQFYKFNPGDTLAKRLGTGEVSGDTESPRLVTGSQPISVPEPVRIVPKVRKVLSAEEMADKMKPAWEKLPEMPESTKEPVLEASEDEQVVTPTPSVPAKADLKGLVCAYIQKFGIEKSAEFFGKAPTIVSGWLNGSKEPPLFAAQMVLDKSPKAKSQYLQVVERVSIDWETGEGTFSRDHTKEELPVDICFCVKGDIPPYVFWALQTAVSQYGIGCKMLTDTIIIRSRNMVANMFLQGKAQWSIWIDADILPTIGNSAWWHAIVRDGGTVNETTASYDFIKRLLSHNKPFTGGVFATRRKNGPLVTQPDLHPRGQADKAASNAMRKNQAKGLLEVDWLSAGLCCIHRSVFETVRKNRPDLQPKIQGEPYPFFTPTGNIGEDVAFSMLAKHAGFKLYLDQELFAAHVGRYAFIPSESQFNGVLDFANA